MAAIEVPFWSKREGLLARECTLCGHRGVFEFYEDPVRVSDEILCLACGAIAFAVVVSDPTPKTLEDLADGS